MNKKKLKVYQEIEEFIINDFNCSINDSNNSSLDYSNIKHRINISFNKKNNNLLMKTIFYSFSCLIVLTIILVTTLFLTKHDIENPPTSEVSPTQPVVQPGTDIVVEKPRYEIKQLNYSYEEKQSDNYYIEIYFSYPSYNGQLGMNVNEYYIHMNNICLGKLGLPKYFNLTVSDSYSVAYCYLNNDEYQKLCSLNIKTMLNRISKKEFVYDCIIYDIDNSNTKAYYKKSSYLTLNMKEVSDRFFKEEDEVLLKVDFNYPEFGNDTSEIANKYDYYKEQNNKYLDELAIDSEIIKNVTISDSSSDIEVVIENYSDYLSIKGALYNASKEAYVNSVTVNLIDILIDVDRMTLPSKSDIDNIKIGMTITEVINILGKAQEVVDENNNVLRYYLNDGNHVDISYKQVENGIFVESILYGGE